MNRIYLDNASTSSPKPPVVMEAMVRFAGRCGTSPGRGAYAEARACQEMIATCRQRLARLIQAEGPDRIVFAMNCSEALAIVIRGLLATAPWSVEQSRRVGAVPTCAATSLARAGGGTHSGRRPDWASG